MKKNIFKLLLFAFYIGSIIVFYANRISPQDMRGLFTLVCYTIPVVLILNIILLVFFIFKKKKLLTILSAIVLLFGMEHMVSTFTFHFSDNSESDIKVLSYNVRVFNTYSELSDENHQSSQKMVEWIAHCNANVLCLQEYYNHDSDTIFDVSQQLNKAGYKYQRVSKALTNRIGASFGMAIFSKFPIIGDGVIVYDEHSQNRISYIDIEIQETIIRIYNVHMQSNYITDRKDPNLTSILRHSAMRRSKQLKSLITHIKSCPYRIILAGDMNDLPYSYTYRQLKNIFNNAFEDKGIGFGFTFNDDLFFLRIDNQFYGKGLEINNFETHKEVSYSDHFPISAAYHISDE